MAGPPKLRGTDTSYPSMVDHADQMHPVTPKWTGKAPDTRGMSVDAEAQALKAKSNPSFQKKMVPENPLQAEVRKASDFIKTRAAGVSALFSMGKK